MKFKPMILAAASLAAIASPAFAQGTKISALPGAAALDGTEKFPAVQGAGNVNVTPAQIRTYTSNAIDVRDYGVTAARSDNSPDINNAVAAAASSGRPLYVPSAGPTGCYKFSTSLAPTGNLSIVGDGAYENWNSGINTPNGAVPVAGSTLCKSSDGTPAIDITATSIRLDLRKIGITFQTPFVGTGDAIRYIPTGTNQGLSGARWDDVIIRGHDGDHYAINLQNPIYGQFSGIRTYGGGGLKIYGTSSSYYFGNMLFDHFNAMVIDAGSANGIDLRASGGHRLNLITFIRPQVNITTDPSPGVTTPSAGVQYMAYMDANVEGIRFIAPDFESNIGNKIRLGKAAVMNDPDYAGMFTTATDIELPAWTLNGVLGQQQTRTLTDVTSSGTVTDTTVFSIPGSTIKASSSTTYPVYSSLFVGAPIAGANVSITRNAAIASNGQIFTTNSLAALGGGFINGNSQYNKNGGSGTTEIGNGSTTGAVTIGGGNNQININAKLLLAQTTVGSLPTCNSGIKGARYDVTDASSPTWNATLSGGGSTLAGAVCDGSAWKAF